MNYKNNINKINLNELITILNNNNKIYNCKKNKDCKCINYLLNKYDGNLQDLQDYIYFDSNKSYTRNLVATDNKTYSLILLCWNKNKFSPIHNHPCNGCWFKILQGKIQEIRYNILDDKLYEIYNKTVYNGIHFMHDNLGLHKIGNPDNIDALTLHLYSPPYNKCNLWLDIDNSNKKKEVISLYDTINGKKII